MACRCVVRTYLLLASATAAVSYVLEVCLERSHKLVFCHTRTTLVLLLYGLKDRSVPDDFVHQQSLDDV